MMETITEARSGTVPRALIDRAATTPDRAAFWWHDGTQWRAQRWVDVLRRVQSVSAWLGRNNIGSGDRIAIMMPSSPEWEYCHLGALAAGCVVVGLDAHDSRENLRYILEVTGPKALLLYSLREKSIVSPLLPVPTACVLLVEAETGDDPTLDEIFADPPAVSKPAPGPDENDLATILFTSGTTGRPKGLGYTHRQLMLATQQILAGFPGVGSDTRLACWLPLSNPFQRIVDLCATVVGAQTYFVPSPSELLRHLPAIRPTLLIGVPRFFEKLHVGIVGDIKRRRRTARTAVRLAWNIGLLRSRRARAHQPIPVWLRIAHRIADKLVLRRIRSVLGGNIDFMISGSAPLSPWLLERFDGLGLRIFEAYGMSENIVPIAINTPQCHRFGSVGRALPANELRTSDDGELLVHSEGLARIRFGVGTENRRTDEDDYLHTGDLGHVDADGYVWLTGRRSEIFKTSTGRRIAPAAVEATLKRLPLVEHAVVIGSGRPFPVAVIALAAGAVPAAELDEGALERISRAIAHVCDELPAYQRPGAVLLTRHTFSIEGGELTANLKLKRAAITSTYAEEVDAAYDLIANSSARRDRPLIREVR